MSIHFGVSYNTISYKFVCFNCLLCLRGFEPTTEWSGMGVHFGFSYNMVSTILFVCLSWEDLNPGPNGEGWESTLGFPTRKDTTTTHLPSTTNNNLTQGHAHEMTSTPICNSRRRDCQDFTPSIPRTMFYFMPPFSFASILRMGSHA